MEYKDSDDNPNTETIHVLNFIIDSSTEYEMGRIVISGNEDLINSSNKQA